ncbi:MAG: DnaJ domain-containing protein, partial [Candidatus Sumerlaeia bacterium]|nr:DnaJ domain-containing protein [Candidatus Sumerlaeia bacterium]
MAQDDYYKLLGISRDSPDREVKRAYYNLARDLHPDKAATPEDAKRNSEQLGLISQAYNTLKDPKKRADYDASLKGKPLSPGASAPRPSAPAAAPAAPPAAGAA